MLLFWYLLRYYLYKVLFILTYEKTYYFMEEDFMALNCLGDPLELPLLKHACL